MPTPPPANIVCMINNTILTQQAKGSLESATMTVSTTKQALVYRLCQHNFKHNRLSIFAWIMLE